MTDLPGLPAGITVFERGWLSANNILFRGSDTSALVDSGYATHAGQTLALVAQALGERPLDLLLNTHLHSDHCGGNAALQQRYPDVHTRIPPGLAASVKDWNPEKLTYTPTGQCCPAFRFDSLLQPGSEVRLGDLPWQIHAAPGHDPHSVVLFEAQSRVLISADALWENGFGVIFPELEGVDAFDEVAATLDLIESLRPKLIIPGHGKVFSHAPEAISRARSRLDSFVGDPRKHARHAAKVLLKFKLLESQRVSIQELVCWAHSTAYLAMVRERYFPGIAASAWLDQLTEDLLRAGAARREGDFLLNA